MSKFKVTSIKSMDNTTMSLTNMRVVGIPRLHPPQITKSGFMVNQCLTVKAVKTDDKPERGVFTIRLWGPLAEDAKNKLKEGDLFSAVARVELYNGRVWNEGNIVTRTDGSPLIVQKASFTASTIIYH